MRLFFICFALLFCGACAPLQATDPFSLGSTELTYTTPEEERDSFNNRRRYVYYKPFPLDSNEYVNKWVTHYSRGDGRWTMKKLLERSNRYFDLMERIFREEGLPEDLVHMVMLESMFEPGARSSKGAEGYWQFIPSTAKNYGLRKNGYIDDRRDFALSTRAAARYLRDLYNEFGDWRLSMAGYNCGETCVNNIIQRYNSRDFWDLVEQGAFQGKLKETKNFVPKIIAMRKIALKPWAYGFYNLNYQAPLEYKLIALEGTFSLSDISEQLDIPYQELKNLNPKLLTDDIPAEEEPFYFRVPTYVHL